MLIRRIVIGLVLALLVALPAMAQDYKVGEAAYVKGDYVNAYKVWAPLATNGNARAQYGVGTMYLMGQGVRQSTPLGTRWIKKSAEQGHVEAIGMLAALYKRGVGVTKDFDMSLKLRRKAANTGDGLAEYNLAVAYLKGQITPKDVATARKLLLSAAGKNIQGAMFNLGILYIKGKDVPFNAVRAHMWFAVAAGWKSTRYGDKPMGSLTLLGKKARDMTERLRSRMTPAQIAEAQKLAREWWARI